MGSFMVIGLFGLIIAMVVNIFLGSTQLEFVIGWRRIDFCWPDRLGYAAYQIHDLAGDSREVAAKKSIFGALTLYLDFINMFLFILRLFGNRDGAYRSFNIKASVW